MSLQCLRFQNFIFCPKHQTAVQRRIVPRIFVSESTLQAETQLILVLAASGRRNAKFFETIFFGLFFVHTCSRASTPTVLAQLSVAHGKQYHVHSANCWIQYLSTETRHVVPFSNFAERSRQYVVHMQAHLVHLPEARIPMLDSACHYFKPGSSRD